MSGIFIIHASKSWCYDIKQICDVKKRCITAKIRVTFIQGEFDIGEIDVDGFSWHGRDYSGCILLSSIIWLSWHAPHFCVFWYHVILMRQGHPWAKKLLKLEVYKCILVPNENAWARYRLRAILVFFSATIMYRTFRAMGIKMCRVLRSIKNS